MREPLGRANSTANEHDDAASSIGVIGFPAKCSRNAARSSPICGGKSKMFCSSATASLSEARQQGRRFFLSSASVRPASHLRSCLSISRKSRTGKSFDPITSRIGQPPRINWRGNNCHWKGNCFSRAYGLHGCGWSREARPTLIGFPGLLSASQLCDAPHRNGSICANGK